MLKISGAILCIAGCAGYGFFKVTGWKRDLIKISQWIFILQKIKSRILYQKETLEESCMWIGEREDRDCGVALHRIGKRAREERDTEFSFIWKEEIELWCRQNGLHKTITELLQQFPEYVREADEELQMNLFSLYLEELNHQKIQLEKQIQEKQKPVLAVSLLGGIMISILLL